MENLDMFWNIARDVWKIESDSIKKLFKVIDKNEFINVLKVIANCKGRVITSGAGTSAVAAKKISHSLSCIEIPSFFLTPSDALHGALGSVQKGDLMILISKGGNTGEVVSLIKPLKEKNITVIGVTECGDSILGEESDFLLKIKIEKEADQFNMLATSSTLSVIAVFDAICVALMKYTKYTKEMFLKIHPSGAVGKRLKESQLKE